jgi:adenosylmethionine-8-amino-7-oxononanoate aminotransferase
MGPIIVLASVAAGQAFSKGVPSWGAHLADNLEDIVLLHGAANVCAVIVEPVAGSAGVLVPPSDYLARLRAICDKHDILLIFDEVKVITRAFASECIVEPCRWPLAQEG